MNVSGHRSGELKVRLLALVALMLAAAWCTHSQTADLGPSDPKFDAVVQSYRAASPKPQLPEEARKYKIQAEGAVNDKDFAEAANLYGRALEIAPWWPDGHFNRALVSAALKRFDQAIVEMQHYLALTPDAPDARLAQDHVYQWQGAEERLRAGETPPVQGASAEQQLTYCLDKEDAYGADIAIGACTARLKFGDQTPISQSAGLAMRGAIYWLLLKDKAQSVADLNNAIAFSPKNADLYNILGKIYLISGDYSKAMIQETVAIRLNPRLTDALMNRGLSYFYEGNYEYSIIDFSNGISINPKDAKLLENRSAAYFKKGEYTRSIADADRAAQLDPGFVPQQERCMARAAANVELDVARLACNAGLSISYNQSDLLLARGLLNFKQSRLQESWDDFNTTVLIAPTNMRALYGRGVAAMKLGHIAEGQADIAKATQGDASVVQSFVRYGMTP